MNNPFGSSSGGGFGASRSMQQGFGSQQQQAPQQQGFGSQQQGFGGFGGFGGQQMQNPFQQAPQQQGFGGYGGQQQGFGGYGGQQQGFGGFGGFGGQQQGFGGYGGQQQYNPYQQMSQQQQYNPYQQQQQQQQYNPYQQMQQQQYNPYQQMQQPQQYNPYQQQMPQQGYGNRGGRGYGRQQAEMGMRQQQAEMGMRQQQAEMARSQMALKMQEPQMEADFLKNTAGYSPDTRRQLLEERQRDMARVPGTGIDGKPLGPDSGAPWMPKVIDDSRGDGMDMPQMSASMDRPQMMSPAVMPQEYGQQQRGFGGFNDLAGMMRGSGKQFQPGLRAQPAKQGFGSDLARADAAARARPDYQKPYDAGQSAQMDMPQISSHVIPQEYGNLGSMLGGYGGGGAA